MSSLPTGSARLVELARALSTGPRSSCSTSPVPVSIERETAALGNLLTSLAAEALAIVLVEHDTDLVMRVCGTVHVLDFGQVIASGPPEEVRRNPAVQEAYLGQPRTPRPRRRRRAAGRGITIEGVRAAYGRIEVLHGVDVRVPGGSVFALLGQTAPARARCSRS